MLPTHFLPDRRHMEGADAVGAIITVDNHRYLMQLRDDIPGIFYPGHWGCFGGAVDANEDPAVALKRELEEELELRATKIDEFVNLDFDLSKIGQKIYYRTYYVVNVSKEEVARFVLHEGADMRAFTPEELFDLRLVPYDSFALWLHFARNRFVPVQHRGRQTRPVHRH